MVVAFSKGEREAKALIKKHKEGSITGWLSSSVKSYIGGASESSPESVDDEEMLTSLVA